MSETVKYVLLKGRAKMGVATDGRLTLAMCAQDGTPYPGTEPIFFAIPGTTVGIVPEDPKVPEVHSPPLNPLINFLDIELLAQFNEKDFIRYQPLWNIIAPTLTWATALIPNQHNMPNMNPTGPPKP